MDFIFAYKQKKSRPLKIGKEVDIMAYVLTGKHQHPSKKFHKQKKCIKVSIVKQKKN